jgi:hypothetical protein
MVTRITISSVAEFAACRDFARRSTIRAAPAR